MCSTYIGSDEWAARLTDGLIAEELRYIVLVGTVLAVAQGTTRVNAQVDRKTMQPTVEDAIELLPFGELKAWYDALSSGCSGDSAEEAGQ